jgi:hypothetical protein
MSADDLISIATSTIYSITTIPILVLKCIVIQENQI